VLISSRFPTVVPAASPTPPVRPPLMPPVVTSQSGESATRVCPVILTLLDARSVSVIPKEYADSDDFSKVSAGFPGMTTILEKIGVYSLAAAVYSFQFSVPTGWYMEWRVAPSPQRRLLSGALYTP
jgi:hypothetical protein